MKIKSTVTLLVIMLSSASTYAYQPVEVGISNDFGAGTEHLIRTRFVSTDWFDTGTYNNYRHGRETHVYRFGPKAIRYILTTDTKAPFNFSHCQNLFYLDPFNQREYISSYLYTGYYSYFNLYIEVDSGYNVWCALETD